MGGVHTVINNNHITNIIITSIVNTQSRRAPGATGQGPFGSMDDGGSLLDRIERLLRGDSEVAHRHSTAENERLLYGDGAVGVAHEATTSEWQPRVCGHSNVMDVALSSPSRQPKPRSPFSTHGLTSHRRSVIFGDALQQCYSNRPSVVFIQARDSSGAHCRVGGDDFRVRLRGPVKEFAAVVRDNGDGTYVAEFVPPLSGEYGLIVTLRGHHVVGSPFVLRVSSGSMHGPSCAIFEVPPEITGGRGGGSATPRPPLALELLALPRPPLLAGDESSLLLEGRDLSGSRLTHGGEHLQAWLRPADGSHPEVEASLVGGPGSRRAPELSIEDHDDGRYVLRYRVFVAGSYCLEVKVARVLEPVAGSPFAVEVVPRPPHASSTTLHAFDAQGAALPHGTPFGAARAGEEVRFLLASHDVHGNACASGGGRFEMTLEQADGDESAAKFFATDLVDRADPRSERPPPHLPSRL